MASFMVNNFPISIFLYMFLRHILQVSEQHLKHATVPGCIVHCLEKSDVTHVLVSYHHGILGLFGDQFNCICAKVQVQTCTLDQVSICFAKAYINLTFTFYIQNDLAVFSYKQVRLMLRDAFKIKKRIF